MDTHAVVCLIFAALALYFVYEWAGHWPGQACAVAVYLLFVIRPVFVYVPGEFSGTVWALAALGGIGMIYAKDRLAKARLQHRNLSRVKSSRRPPDDWI
jgi:hypothetical protein